MFFVFCHLWGATFDEIIYLDASDKRKNEGEKEKRPCKIYHLGLKITVLLRNLPGFERDALLLECVVAGHFRKLREQKCEPMNNFI